MTGKRKILIAVAAVLLIIVAGAYGAWRYLSSPYQGPDVAWVYLPHGSTRQALADSLKSALGDRTGSRVAAIYGAVAKADAQLYGAYRIEPGTSAKAIAQRLVRHRQTPVRLTFNNVRTLPQLAERISSQMDFSAGEFLAAADSLLPAAGFKSAAQYPAAFLPDTYEFYWSTGAGPTVARLLEERNRFWNDSRRQKAAALGLTPVQAATLASIAEEETNNKAERAVVARLYLNRLHKGMKLQADPTVKFALGDFSLRRIRGEHLKVQSPYNTYNVAGLPPGPIRVADGATIDGLLNSQPHKWIYMCAKEDFSGTHNFAADYSAHMDNARRYQRALNSRGIK
ncbi:MAG: endolytic transglycosylase MltG [Muribaculaceae bacterium]|nr:endolytic transglycosylase MltG [Muribaculaceae bacterium]